MLAPQWIIVTALRFRSSPKCKQRNFVRFCFLNDVFFFSVCRIRWTLPNGNNNILSDIKRWKYQHFWWVKVAKSYQCNIMFGKCVLFHKNLYTAKWNPTLWRETLFCNKYRRHFTHLYNEYMCLQINKKNACRWRSIVSRTNPIKNISTCFDVIVWLNFIAL